MKQFFLFLIIGFILCGAINAQINYGIYIAGTELTSANVDTIDGKNFPNLELTNGTITYNHDAKTFTLNDVNANVNSGSFILIREYSEVADYKINLIGNNIVNTDANAAINTFRMLIIEGDGSIKATSNKDCGIYIHDNTTLKISNTRVEAIGKWGIAGMEGSFEETLIIENSTVKATGPSGSICHLQNITLTDCKITQPAGAVIGTSNYTLAITHNGLLVTSEVIIEPETGINNFNSEAAFSIYPNPATNLINIISENANEIVTISDISGKIVYSEKTSDKQSSINISQLSAGMYIIRIGSKTAKFVKE